MTKESFIRHRRATTDDEKRNCNITIRVNKYQKAMLDAEAKARGVSKSKLVTDLIEKEFYTSLTKPEDELDVSDNYFKVLLTNKMARRLKSILFVTNYDKDKFLKLMINFIYNKIISIDNKSHSSYLSNMEREVESEEYVNRLNDRWKYVDGRDINE